MPARVVRSRPANADLADIARWTVTRFGPAQARRYGAVIAATLSGLHRMPDIVGVRARPELGLNTWTIPSGLSRTRARHIVVFSFDPVARPATVTVLRILHNSMELTRHRLIEDPP